MSVSMKTCTYLFVALVLLITAAFYLLTNRAGVVNYGNGTRMIYAQRDDHTTVSAYFMAAHSEEGYSVHLHGTVASWNYYDFAWTPHGFYWNLWRQHFAHEG